MLKTRQSITVQGECQVDGVGIAGYSANIDSTNPNIVQITYWQTDPVAYKNNRAAAREDQAAFEDMVYEIQEELLADLDQSSLEA